ncbi:GDSL lipase/esterase [Cladorrhinum sp. PSN259]|nr:GDSL lipase/esterase [Cladorrhinum sp. PSN259]
MLFSSLVLAGASLVAASPPTPRGPNKNSAFTNLVTFGDSYTDNGRLGYYINNAGQAPPPGQLHPESNNTASGGRTWAQYAAQNAGARLADYAVGGATCSNNIVERDASFIGRSFPAVLEDEIPSFKADVSYSSVFPNRKADNTVYALWIGTNDLGFGAFLSDSQAPGTTITDFVGCVFTVFDEIYKTGGRRFVLLNEAPLERSPLYAPTSRGGTGDSQFWNTKSKYNTTEYSEKIKEYTTSVNTIFEYGIAVEQAIKSRWPKATVDLFDVHSLFLDIMKAPSQYLDAPYNVDSYWHQCNSAGGSCVDQTAVGPLSGFLWYDELHPSAKADSIIAKHFIDVVNGNSKYGTRFQSK